MAQHALVDTNVLYGAFQQRDQFHDEGLSIVTAADARDLPVCVVLDFVLAETMNALTQERAHAGTRSRRNALTQELAHAGTRSRGDDRGPLDGS
ncbi:hypothetical protein [Halococcus sp. PRR34]|uniref:hypothetical protein n=1 Tax=Halococcus sp. PRR34 TaxID=3020830 RepID=UPI00236263AC|nr:hypothetical protein [Halococcus sp. PRR34]